MADFAVNTTARYKFRYRHAGAKHVMGWRDVDSERDDAAHTSKLAAFLSTLNEYMYDDFSPISIGYIPQNGSSEFAVALPDFSAVVPGIPIAQAKISQQAMQTRWEGKSLLGSRVSLYFFGLQLGNFDGANGLQDFRVYAGEDTTILASIDALSELAPHWGSIDNVPCIWKPYVNTKFNDHWVGKVRA